MRSSPGPPAAPDYRANVSHALLAKRPQHVAPGSALQARLPTNPHVGNIRRSSVGGAVHSFTTEVVAPPAGKFLKFARSGRSARSRCRPQECQRHGVADSVTDGTPTTRGLALARIVEKGMGTHCDLRDVSALFGKWSLHHPTPVTDGQFFASANRPAI